MGPHLPGTLTTPHIKPQTTTHTDTQTSPHGQTLPLTVINAGTTGTGLTSARGMGHSTHTQQGQEDGGWVFNSFSTKDGSEYILHCRDIFFGPKPKRPLRVRFKKKKKGRFCFSFFSQPLVECGTGASPAQHAHKGQDLTPTHKHPRPQHPHQHPHPQHPHQHPPPQLPPPSFM